MSRIDSLQEFRRIVELGSKFLLCGTLRADLPYPKVKEIREKNRRLGLGLMGIHEWLLKRGQKYEVCPELHQWLWVYKHYSEKGTNELCDTIGINRPVAYRAIAPTGTIGMIAGTTTGIEPLFAVAYKRRFLKGAKRWMYQYVVDGTAKTVIEEGGIDPEKIDTAYGMAEDFERRIRFQADVQDYVDMAISSTINIPSWGSEANNPDKVKEFAKTLSKYAHRLRGFTVYPDGSRGGQPITECSYKEAMSHGDHIYEENDSCKGGVCGL
jgi:ribonucleoside-diphosphate reductase alpha chain